MFQPIYTTIITNKQKSLGKGSGWRISKYNSLAGSSYIKLERIKQKVEKIKKN